MQATRGRGDSSCSFLTSALDGGAWSASRPGQLYPQERTSSTHCAGGWVGLEAGLDTEHRGKSLCFRGSNPDRPVVRSTNGRCIFSRLLLHGVPELSLTVWAATGTQVWELPALYHTPYFELVVFKCSTKVTRFSLSCLLQYRWK
jgi:hypothetical protein